MIALWEESGGSWLFSVLVRTVMGEVEELGLRFSAGVDVAVRSEVVGTRFTAPLSFLSSREPVTFSIFCVFGALSQMCFKPLAKPSS